MIKIDRFILRDESWGAILQDLENDRIWALSKDAVCDLKSGKLDAFQNNLLLKNPYLYEDNFVVGDLDTSRIEGLSAPISLSWELTNKCNSACLFCCNQANEHLDMRECDFDEIKEKLDLIKKWNVLRVIVGGGEPLVRKDIFKILKYMRDIGLYPILATNGILLSKNVEEIAKRCFSIQISLDTFDRQTYIKIRGIDGLQRVCEGINAVLAQGMTVKVVTVINRYNFDELEGIADYLSGLKIKQWFLFHLLPAGRALTNPCDITGEQKISLNGKLTDLRRKYPDMAIYLWGDKESDGTSVYLKENGEFILRDYFDNSTKNLGDTIEQLQDNWENLSLKAKRNTLINFTQKAFNV